MEIVVYPPITKQSIMGTCDYEQVQEHDPIRKLLDGVSFDSILYKLKETDFERYSFMVEVLCGDRNMRVVHNLFFLRDVKFEITSGKYKGEKFIPIPPIAIYKRKVHFHNQLYCNDQRSWLANMAIKMIQIRNVPILFTAGFLTETIMVNNNIYNQLQVVHSEVPLLVISSEKDSLEFAKLTMDLLHSDYRSHTISNILKQYTHIVPTRLSIHRLRHLRDIFMEEFITIPCHIRHLFYGLDSYELSDEDVHELSDCLKK